MACTLFVPSTCSRRDALTFQRVCLPPQPGCPHDSRGTGEQLTCTFITAMRRMFRLPCTLTNPPPCFGRSASTSHNVSCSTSRSDEIAAEERRARLLAELETLQRRMADAEGLLREVDSCLQSKPRKRYIYIYTETLLKANEVKCCAYRLYGARYDRKRGIVYTYEKFAEGQRS